jgi:hypothetical protein
MNEAREKRGIMMNEPRCICKTWETRLKDCEGTHRALVDECPIHGKVRAEAVAPEPPDAVWCCKYHLDGGSYSDSCRGGPIEIRKVAEAVAPEPINEYEVRKALAYWMKRSEEAEAKLAENGIIWEEGKGYVFDGKE